jgi:hypothetical protein
MSEAGAQMRTMTVIDYKGYRIEVSAVGKGWRASIFSPDSTSPWPNSPVNLEKSSTEEIVAEAKRIIEIRLGPYSAALTVADCYVPFTGIGAAVMKMLADTHGIKIRDEDKRELTDKFSTMPPYPDVRVALSKLHAAGFRLFTLTNNIIEVQTRQMEHADTPRTELSIELDRRQPSDLTVVIKQTLCLLVGRFGLGLRHARCQQDQQREAPIRLFAALIERAAAACARGRLHAGRVERVRLKTLLRVDLVRQNDKIGVTAIGLMQSRQWSSSGSPSPGRRSCPNATAMKHQFEQTAQRIQKFRHIHYCS